MPDDATADYVRRLLDETREELVRTESRANLLLAAVIAGGGAVVAGVTAQGSPLRDHPWSVKLTALFALATVVAGILTLASSVWPRLRRSPTGAVDYFGDVAGFDDADSLGRRLEVDAAEALRRDVSQLWMLSRIVLARYHAIRIAMLLLGVAIGFGIAASLLTALA